MPSAVLSANHRVVRDRRNVHSWPTETEYGDKSIQGLAATTNNGEINLQLLACSVLIENDRLRSVTAPASPRAEKYRRSCCASVSHAEARLPVSNRLSHLDAFLVMRPEQVQIGGSRRMRRVIIQPSLPGGSVTSPRSCCGDSLDAHAPTGQILRSPLITPGST